MVIYALLKVQGEIFCELRDFHKALQCYQTLRNFCRNWEAIQLEMWTLEAMAAAFKLSQSYEQSIYYLHEAVKLSWELGDTDAELRIYEQLAIGYYYTASIQKSKQYH